MYIWSWYMKLVYWTEHWTAFQCMILAVINTSKVAACTAWKISIYIHNSQLSVGLIAQMVKHCTGIAEVEVHVSFKPLISQAFPATTYLANSNNFKDQTSLQAALQIREFHLSTTSLSSYIITLVWRKTLFFNLIFITREFWSGTNWIPSLLV